MSRSLVKVEPDSISNAIDEVMSRKRSITLPLDEKPIGLNDINVLSYCILREALDELKPGELSFVAQMANTASISDRQRNWLKKIAIHYLGFDVDAKPDAGSFTVTVESAKQPKSVAANDNPPKKQSRRKAA